MCMCVYAIDLKSPRADLWCEMAYLLWNCPFISENLMHLKKLILRLQRTLWKSVTVVVARSSKSESDGHKLKPTPSLPQMEDHYTSNFRLFQTFKTLKLVKKNQMGSVPHCFQKNCHVFVVIRYIFLAWLHNFRGHFLKNQTPQFSAWAFVFMFLWQNEQKTEIKVKILERK